MSSIKFQYGVPNEFYTIEPNSIPVSSLVENEVLRMDCARFVNILNSRDGTIETRPGVKMNDEENIVIYYIGNSDIAKGDSHPLGSRGQWIVHMYDHFFGFAGVSTNNGIVCTKHIPEMCSIADVLHTKECYETNQKYLDGPWVVYYINPFGSFVKVASFDVKDAAERRCNVLMKILARYGMPGVDTKESRINRDYVELVQSQAQYADVCKQIYDLVVSKVTA